MTYTLPDSTPNIGRPGHAHRPATAGLSTTIRRATWHIWNHDSTNTASLFLLLFHYHLSCRVTSTIAICLRVDVVLMVVGLATHTINIGFWRTALSK